MMLNVLKRINDAPEKGTRLIYTMHKVVFDDYDNREKCFDDISDDKVLEVHLFDQFREYRAVVSESITRPNGVVEHLADFEDKDDSVYKEVCFLEDRGELTVLNHINYDNNNGMISIDDYRLIRG